MNEYTIYYEHTQYGFYVTEIDAPTILQALTEFTNDYAHNGIYGIMVKRGQL